MTRTRRSLHVVLALFLVLGLAEAVARLLPEPPAGTTEALPRFDRNPELKPGAERFWRRDASLFWRMRGNLSVDFGGMPLRTNSGGFRDQEHPAEPLPDQFVIACLGDSTTFGWGVSDEATIYPARLQRHLGARVLNFGQSGYSTFQGLRLLRGEIVPLRPQAVVFLFGPNDYAEASGLADSDQPGIVGGDRVVRLQETLGGSAFYRRLSGALVRARDAALFPRHEGPRRASPVLRRVGPEQFRDNLTAMVAETKGAGAIPVLVTYPRRPLNPVLSCAVPSSDDEVLVARYLEAIRSQGEIFSSPVTQVLRLAPSDLETALSVWETIRPAAHSSPAWDYGRGYLLQRAGRSAEAEAALQSAAGSRAAVPAGCDLDLFSTALFRYLEEPAAIAYNRILSEVARDTGAILVDAAQRLADAQRDLAARSRSRGDPWTRTLSIWFGSESVFHDVVHPSAHGHALVADTLAEALTATRRPASSRAP